jgi:5-methylcytosine-specific restriction endonuclease McrA
MKHERTKATEISMKTKQIVWERDNQQCIFCKRWVSVHFANAHFIKRSQGGLGIPENVFTACAECHWQEDMGFHQESYREVAENYLRNYYGSSWNIESLIYKKGDA